MQATVDIRTGHKTVLQYLLKPVLRAKENGAARALRDSHVRHRECAHGQSGSLADRARRSRGGRRGSAYRRAVRMLFPAAAAAGAAGRPAYTRKHRAGSSRSCSKSVSATQIVALADEPDEDQELALFSAGVRGVCALDTSADVLARIVSVVLQGELWIRRSLVAKLLDSLVGKRSGHDGCHRPIRDSHAARDRDRAAHRPGREQQAHCASPGDRRADGERPPHRHLSQDRRRRPADTRTPDRAPALISTAVHCARPKWRRDRSLSFPVRR